MSKFCPFCGESLPDHAGFCPECGKKLPDSPAGEAETTEAKSSRPSPAVSETIPEARAVTSTGNILLYPDGKYRWAYELNMLTNPSILFVVFKVFFWIFVGIWAFVVLLSLGEPGSFWENAWETTRVFALVTAGFFVIAYIGYLLYALILGGKYCVLFIMDEEGVTHQQQEKHTKKSDLIAALTVLAGAASGNPTTMGIGLNAARSTMTSEFKNVRSVQAFPKRNLIKVNQTLAKNQVYAEDEDFEFVRSYIVSHCPKAKIR